MLYHKSAVGTGLFGASLPAIAAELLEKTLHGHRLHMERFERSQLVNTFLLGKTPTYIIIKNADIIPVLKASSVFTA